MNRRSFLMIAAAFALPVRAAPAVNVIDVYKSPYCGCCCDWIAHMRANGFEVKVHEVSEPAVYRARYGVPDTLGSCHTAHIAGYAIEGHVPAREIKRLVAELPKAQGLAVPGMVPGSPGMTGDRIATYDVLLFQRDGRHSTYARYTGERRVG